MTESPIENFLDELMRRTRADPRTVRRLLDEAADHLYAVATELEAEGMARGEAEREAVRRFGPAGPIAHAAARTGYAALLVDVGRAAATLFGAALVVAGVSGLLALVMVLAFGDQFVGSVGLFPFRGASFATTAWGTVILRVVLGLLGVLVLYGNEALRRRSARPRTLPTCLVDSWATCGFAVATLALALGCVAQAVQNGPTYIGYPLSAALGTLAGTVYFARRIARDLLSGTPGTRGTVPLKADPSTAR
jgi:hypothetical protein